MHLKHPVRPGSQASLPLLESTLRRNESRTQGKTQEQHIILTTPHTQTEQTEANEGEERQQQTRTSLSPSGRDIRDQVSILARLNNHGLLQESSITLIGQLCHRR